MAYTLTEWQTGDVITADGLNSMAAYPVKFTYDNETSAWSCDKTEEEILAAFLSGRNVYAVIPNDETPESYDVDVLPLVKAAAQGAYFTRVFPTGETSAELVSASIVNGTANCTWYSFVITVS